jgi:plasmid stability protein
MSLDLKPVQVRLPEEAYAALKLCADAESKDLGEKARELLVMALLGEAHAVIETAERLSRAVTCGGSRQQQSTHDCASVTIDAPFGVPREGCRR